MTDLESEIVAFLREQEVKPCPAIEHLYGWQEAMIVQIFIDIRHDLDTVGSVKTVYSYYFEIPDGYGGTIRSPYRITLQNFIVHLEKLPMSIGSVEYGKLQKLIGYLQKAIAMRKKEQLACV